MNTALLIKHIKKYKKQISGDKASYEQDKNERFERSAYYRSWTPERIIKMNEDEFYDYMSRLWAMLIWGNKKYAADKLIMDNGFEKLKKELSNLIWGKENIENRWDRFRSKIKGMGPAMMSEILCHVHSKKHVLWNRRAFVGLHYLGVKNLPRYNYQLTGKRYKQLSDIALSISKEMSNEGIQDSNLLSVDYFIWHELQVEDNLSQIHTKEKADKRKTEDVEKVDKKTSEFIHNEIRDKLSDIGQWLGFRSNTEIKVADGSKVDTVWEATIGNMGRVIYVFEVQTKAQLIACC